MHKCRCSRKAAPPDAVVVKGGCRQAHRMTFVYLLNPAGRGERGEACAAAGGAQDRKYGASKPYNYRSPCQSLRPGSELCLEAQRQNAQSNALRNWV